jgi:hypothetical protein
MKALVAGGGEIEREVMVIMESTVGYNRLKGAVPIFIIIFDWSN